MRALLVRRVGELILELLERLCDRLEDGAILGAFGSSYFIFIRDTGEGRDHGLMVLVLLDRKIG
jgi:hypothetical protein